MMYDDYPPEPLFDPAPRWMEEDDWGDPGPRELHLCRECRDLMSAAVRAGERLAARPPEPDWARALRWLDRHCGGRDAVLALDDAPLAGSPALPDDLEDLPRQRLGSLIAVLDGVACEFFDEEAGIALSRAVLRVFERAPGIVLGTQRSAQVALGVVWAVGHANGLLHPIGAVTERPLKDRLGATQSGSTLGRRVQSALTGPYRWSDVSRPLRYGGYSARDLEPLGHPDLLVSPTRRRLIEVRDRALADRERQREEPFSRAG